MRRIAILSVVISALVVVSGRSDEIQFIEDFSLAGDRAAALAQLIPGTEDYYYYHCLNYQNKQQFDKVDDLLKDWIKRHGYTTRVLEIKNRQALLTYEKNPQASLEYVRGRLGIEFNHQREILGGKPNLPNTLDQKLISRPALTKRALANYKNLEGFEHAALDWLVAEDLNPDRRRHLLQRLQRPDHDNLAKLVVDDLNHRYSGGFGSFTIHRQLLLNQLEACLKLKPELLNQTHFVNTYLSKLRPNADVDWRHDSDEHVAFLNRLWSFVRRLAPVHNSLKAHVLYHRLVHDRSRGVYDKERFMTYIKLPRNASYVERKFLEQDENRKYRADLNADYGNFTLLPPVGDDEPLVRSYLHQFFVGAKSFAEFEPYISDLYLKRHFAETKIVNGLGEPEQWYSMLQPAEYRALKERIDLDFAHTNRVIFDAGEPVSLDLNVKNVRSLIVKVFEINTLNYYRENLQEVDTDVNLDGLVANYEVTHKYDLPPLRRVARHFEFPELKNPGVYVIDFIGNGRSSRALVRKGKLRHLVRNSVAGHVFTVLDDDNGKLAGASLRVAGHKYEAGKDGLITVPYSNQPGRQPIILSHDGLHWLDHFQHDAEDYSLVAGIYVDRESLLRRKKAQVVVRPSLQLNGTPVTLSLLEDVRLVITSTDLDGVSTTKEVADFKLAENREATFEFQVPVRLAAIGFTLSAKVQNLSQNTKADLTASQQFSLNGIDRTEKIGDLHLAKVGGGYELRLLGRSGEPKSDRAVHLTIKHRDFGQPVNVTLATDPAGRIQLGELADITSINAKGPEGASHTWPLVRDARTYHQSLSGVAGEPLEVPYMGSGDQPARNAISLLELRGDTFVADRFDAVSIEDGFLKLGKLPRGDYDLLLKDGRTRIRVRIAEGEQREGYVLSENRQLELRGRDALHIASVTAADEAITVQLKNAGDFARLHVFGTRYQPAYSAYNHLSGVRDPEPYLISVPKLKSLYVEGRDIGDEFRYIIERKYAKRFPGNMLARPSLLLNPWAIRKTATTHQFAAPGEDFGGKNGQRAGTSTRTPPKTPPPSPHGDFANLDFLAQSSAVMLNLIPDKKGLVTIDRSVLGAHQQLQFVAVDPSSTVFRSISLPAVKTDHLDLRLARGLDPAKHFTQQKQISVVKPKAEFVINDITTTEFEAYDSLLRVYSLYATLSRDPKLIEFSFILNWPDMKPEEKRAKYSKYACHELSFFLYKKDPEFFKQVVAPYLKNKKDKTFLDACLLGEDLREYLTPWNHDQLNVVERILLGRHVKNERLVMARHVTDMFDLLPPNVDHDNFLFSTAIKGSALDTGDSLDFDKSKETATKNGDDKPRAELQPTMDPAAPPKPGTRPGYGPGEKGEGQSGGEGKGDGRDGNNENAKKMAEKAEERLDDYLEDKRRSGRARNRADDGKDGYFNKDLDRRKQATQFYRKLDKTQEWVENNYYHLPIEQQVADLVRVNAFWRDYAAHSADDPFYSTNLAHVARNFPEMMFALSVLDLPFEAGDHKTAYEDSKLTLTAGSPIVVFHEEIKPADWEPGETRILVSQNFFQHSDRYRYVNNQRYDKYVSDEYLVHTVYGCQVVVTNPTSSPQKLDVLVQVPVGAVPVLGSRYTRSVHIDLNPYHTRTIEYYFYFPAAGGYAHYPVHVSNNERLLSFAEPVTLNVVNEPSKIDRTSWAFISQHGSSEDVLAYLNRHNLLRTNLDRIAFRMADAPFFKKVIDVLSRRRVYNNTLWSYGIKHNHVPAIREYLQHADNFVRTCGSYLDSRLLTIDPVVRRTYQHRDYRPLVNSRAHQLGRRRRILNDRFHGQYHQLLKILSYKRQLDDEDLMAVTYYMLLQDRIEEALGFFGRVNSENLHTRLQYDLFAAYVDMFSDEPQAARAIAERYADHPVDRWRNAFVTVIDQLDEIEGEPVKVVDDEDRTQVQTGLAASSASFDFKVESKAVVLSHQNLDKVLVNFYEMDIELLFSRNPFVQEYSSQFSYIRPNLTRTVKLAADDASTTFELPAALHNNNVLVEITGGGQTKSQAYYSNSLGLQVIENYGQARVTHSKTGRPIAKTYVKVYARMQDGRIRFYKDGYTDLRGRFDYTSLNTNELDFVDKFSLLVFSDSHGAVVREASPPKR